MKIGSAISTGWEAAALLAAFETLWVVVLEREQPIGYFALTTGLLMASATTVALVFSFTDRPPPWIAAVLAGAGAWLAWGGTSAVAATAALLVLFRFGHSGEARPSLYGVAVAVGLGVAGIVAPRLLTRVSFIQDSSELTIHLLLTAMLIGVVFGVVAICNRVAGGRFGQVTVAVLALGFLSLGALPSLSQNQRVLIETPDPVAATAGPSRPHVLLLVLDTVRADHMTFYGYERPTTPQLEAFFEDRPGTAVFPSIYANANWTVPSHASLFTGLLPGEHGAHFGEGSRTSFSLGDHPTLAERMRSAGYRTIGIYANPWLGHVDGMDRGFDVYRSPLVPTRLPYFGEALRRLVVPGLYPQVFHAVPQGDAILAAIESEFMACGDQPCFAFANLIDAHSFYVANRCRGRFAEWSLREQVTLLSINDPPERTAHLMARYDEEICELDLVLVELLERLEAAGVLDETWVIITSDHGEAFGDHQNTEHGTSVYNDQIWIPLLVIPPAGVTVEAGHEPGSLIDVSATIASIGGAEPIGNGRDLRRPPQNEVSAATEFYGDPAKQASQDPRAADSARAITRGGLKLVDQSGRLELFDLRVDPHERIDLATKMPEVVVELEEYLPELRFNEDAHSREDQLPDGLIEQLRELGYGQ